MEFRFTYAIKYVADMQQAVRFHRDALGLPLKFETPEWTEFATGDVTLALHLATSEHAAGHVELGFGTGDVRKLYAERAQNGLRFEGAPRELHGQVLATFLDSDGAACSVSSR